MFKSVQDVIRPNLIPVENRGQVLKTLGPTSARLTPGSAVAIMGPPGANLTRLATDIIRGIADITLVVWVDLSDIKTMVNVAGDPEDDRREERMWNRAILTKLSSSLARALAPEDEASGISDVTFDVTPRQSNGEEPKRIEKLLLHFNQEAFQRRVWPVIVLESMHDIPWPVNLRLQQTLRVALDNQSRTQVLRLVMTAHSDFLSGDYLGDGDAFLASPLYERTSRYIVAPFTADDLCELTPLPGGLPDDLLKVLVLVTGGLAGYLEACMSAIDQDNALGQALYDTFSATDDPPAWLWEWLARSEGLAEPWRALVRQGLAVMLTSAKGRSKRVIDALVRLMADEPVVETSPETLLPLELAGIARLDEEDGLFVYEFATPLVRPLLEAILPRDKTMHDRVVTYGREQMSANTKSSRPPPKTARATTEIKTTRGQRHVWTRIRPEGPQEDPTAGPGEQEVSQDAQRPDARNPLYLSEPLAALVKDRTPSSARAIIELLKEVVRAVKQARSEGNLQWLTLSQLDIDWRPLEDAGDGMGASPIGNATITAELPGRELRGRWEVSLKSTPPDTAEQVAAGALFVPPDRLPAFIGQIDGANTLRPNESDDVYAIGILAGLLLTRTSSPQLMLNALEGRLTGALDVSVGRLVRLLGRCLAANADDRPSLDEVRKGLHGVLHDPLARWRRVLRYLLILSFVALVGTALYDFFLDTQVDNPSRFYTMVKVVGATGAAAFYFLAWFLFGRTDKAQLHRALWDFLRQRMNRFRWLLIPTIVAMGMSWVFAYRIWHSREIKVALPRGALLEEIRTRQAGATRCESVYRFPKPTSNASVRLPLDGDRSYSFIVVREEGEERYRRAEYYWPPELVVAQRQKPWGDTLDIYRLPPAPPDGQGCLPMIDDFTGPHPPFVPAGHGEVRAIQVESAEDDVHSSGTPPPPGEGEAAASTPEPEMTPRPLPRGVPATIEGALPGATPAPQSTPEE